jgi:adenylosuccinate synthase
VDIDATLKEYEQYREILAPMITDTRFHIYNALKKNQTLLAEAANAAMLDIDHGTYPYVTSSSTTAGGISTGLGIPPNQIQTVIGVVKAYTTRVGAGPFPTELFDVNGDHLRTVGGEFGTTTGRPRRCGWLDIPVLRYSHAINGFTSLNITKLDVLTGIKTIRIAVAYKFKGARVPDGYFPASLSELNAYEVEYEDMPGWTESIKDCRLISELPTNARKYVERIEQLVGVPVSWVGVGPGRNDMATSGFAQM